jgi:glycosyltransferase involved in cell wall biosynthesis
VKVALDATPLLGQRSGVGRYVTGLLHGLAEVAPWLHPRLTLFSVRGTLPADVPPGAVRSPGRFPARLLRPLWAHTPLPPVEVLTGRVDVFHGTNFVLPPAALAGGVVTVHDLAYLRFPETVTGDVARYARMVPLALRRASAVLTVSETIAAELRAEYGAALPPVFVAPNGVDARWLSAAPAAPGDLRRLGLPDDYLLFAGNLEPRKGLGLLLAAHRAARRADPATPQLVLCGPAGWGDRWQGDAPDPADVLLAGYLSDEDLRGVVARARAICTPSSYEGFGLPVLEGLAAGRTVLASDIAAHREVAGGHAMLLPREVDVWTDALLALDGTSKSDRAAGRQWAAGFTWTRSAEVHLAAYRAAGD